MDAGSWLETGIAGVRLFALETHGDARGSLVEIYRRSWVDVGREVVQANLSRSRARVLRGLHWHRRQADYWCVVSGVAHVALVDLRPGSPTRTTSLLRRMDGSADLVAMSIPPGVAHGFFAETDVALLYLVDEAYTGNDEFGLSWDDPALGLSWPVRDPVLSERDRANPSLEEALRAIEGE